MSTLKLSKKARNVLSEASREYVAVTPDNLDAYRELTKAGLMEPFSGFMRGPEATFRFTQEGWHRREEFQCSRLTPLAILRRIFRALMVAHRLTAMMTLSQILSRFWRDLSISGNGLLGAART